MAPKCPIECPPKWSNIKETLTHVKTHMIATVVLCVAQIILALVTIIPLALSSNEAGGRCLLYATRTGSGPDSVCDFIYTEVAILQICFCLARAIVIVVVLFDKLEQGWLVWVPVMVGVAVVDVVGWVMTLVAGGMVSHGFSILCSLLTPRQCGELPIYIMPTSSLVRNYYSDLNIVLEGVWVSWLFWILLVLEDVYVLWREDYAGLQEKIKFRK